MAEARPPGPRAPRNREAPVPESVPVRRTQSERIAEALYTKPEALLYLVEKYLLPKLFVHLRGVVFDVLDEELTAAQVARKAGTPLDTTSSEFAKRVDHGVVEMQKRTHLLLMHIVEYVMLLLYHPRPREVPSIWTRKDREMTTPATAAAAAAAAEPAESGFSPSSELP